MFFSFIKFVLYDLYVNEFRIFKFLLVGSYGYFIVSVNIIY